MTNCNFCIILQNFFVSQRPTQSALVVKDEARLNINDTFLPGKILGNGRFSQVRQVLDRKEGSSYAIKKIKKFKLTDKEYMLLKNEIKIQSSLSHPSIIKLYAFANDEHYYYLFTEMAHGGEFLDEFSSSSYNMQESIKVITSLLEAINYCHIKKITHRDIKPGNIFHANDYNSKVKIGDWGFAKYTPNDYSLQTQCGTAAFIAPEGNCYGTKVDIWSLGVVFHQLLLGYHPFYHSDQSVMFHNIKNGISQKIRNCNDINTDSNEIHDFLVKLLAINPRKRISASEALQHPFVLQYDKSAEIDDLSRSDLFANALAKLKASVLAVKFVNKMSCNVPRKEFDPKKTFKATVKLISASSYLKEHVAVDK